MPVSVLTALPISREEDAFGNILGGGLLYTFQAGSSTPLPTYQDVGCSVPNTNPVVLDATGRAIVRYLPQAYKLKLTMPDSAPGKGDGTVLWTLDNFWPPVSTEPISGSQFVGSVLFPTTTAEAAAGITPVNFIYPPLNIRRYGADSTGVASSDLAMSAAISVCGIAGGTIRAPGGVYLFNNTISLDSKVSIFIEGDGGANAAAATPTILQYSGGGTANFISAGSSSGCSLRKLAIVPVQAAFSGTLVALGHGVAGSDANFFSMLDCSLGTVANTTCTHLNLDKSVNSTFERLNFTGGAVSVKGQASVGGSYSIAMTFKLCQWVGSSLNPVAYCGEAWTFDSCTFEGVVSAPSVIAGGIGMIATTPAKALTIRGCWFGDATAGGGIWITHFGTGLSIVGNRFGGSVSGANSYAISLNTSQGVNINANSFDTFTGCVDFSTGPITAVSLKDNFVTGPSPTLITNAANVPANAEVNPNIPITPLPATVGLLAANGYLVDANGVIEQWGNVNVTTATPLVVTFATTGIVFPTACWNVSATMAAPSNGANTMYLSSSITRQQFTVNVQGTGGTNTVYWRAKGN